MRAATNTLGDLIGFCAYSFAVSGRLPSRDQLHAALATRKSRSLSDHRFASHPAREQTKTPATGGDSLLSRTPAEEDPEAPPREPALSTRRETR
jgi:hypothetical protein